MRIPGLTSLAFLTTMTVSVVAQVQTASVPAASETIPSTSKAPLEIISHRIGSDYYPMLDRPSSTTPAMTADVGELPPTDNERLARQRRNTRTTANSTASEDKRTRGRLFSYLRVIDDAQWVQLVIKNTDRRQIVSVDWDFAFPRYEAGELVPRYDVSSNVEIKPGAKRTLKCKLPADAKKCEVVRVVRDDKQEQRTSTFEAVCGQGFQDPQLQGQKTETISIKRIAYADGTVWKAQP